MKIKKELKIGIVCADFYQDISEKLLQGALGVLRHKGISKKNIKVIYVPGCFEIPIALKRLAETKKYNALVALGCIIQGKSDHHIYVAQGSTYGLMNVILKYDTSIGMGIITAHNKRQALARAGDKKNYGSAAAKAALAMIIK